MRVQVASGNTRSFIAFAQARSFLAVRRARGSVEVSPLITWSASADERRVATMLTEWEQFAGRARLHSPGWDRAEAATAHG